MSTRKKCRVKGCTGVLMSTNETGVCSACRRGGRLCRFCDAILPQRGSICRSCHRAGLRTTVLLQGFRRVPRR